MIYEVADENAKNEYVIPVCWEVSGKVRVQANSLQEAYEYVEKNLDNIPLDDDEEYSEGSYQISVDNVDECTIYQRDELVCIDFGCDEDLTKYIDSTPFDSDALIAEAEFLSKGVTLDIKLIAIDKAKVIYKGVVYNADSEFPKRLIDNITDHLWLEKDLSKMSKQDVFDNIQKIAKSYFNIK